MHYGEPEVPSGKTILVLIVDRRNFDVSLAICYIYKIMILSLYLWVQFFVLQLLTTTIIQMSSRKSFVKFFIVNLVHRE